jgi:hypothetical protein
MSRRAYIITFVLSAFTFFPVVFSLILFPVSMVGPCSYVAFVTASNFFATVSQAGCFGLLIDGFNYLIIAVYCGLFYLCARLTFTLSNEFEKAAGKILFQIICLLIVFASSFLNVIHSDSFVNATGTYNFWTGCVRFLETN